MLMPPLRAYLAGWCCRSFEAWGKGRPAASPVYGAAKPDGGWRRQRNWPVGHWTGLSVCHARTHVTRV